MDQQPGEGVASNAVIKVGNTVNDLATQVQKMAEEKIDQGNRVLRDLQASAGEAIETAAELARKASTAGVDAVTQASETIQGVAREAGNQAGQAATAVYQQGARAGGYVSRYAAEQPLTALLIAGAVGYALAYMLHRP
jgi:ElaB/YqjD/DUF883 family membrane-anchored ribosome-binding protein